MPSKIIEVVAHTISPFLVFMYTYIVCIYIYTCMYLNFVILISVYIHVYISLHVVDRFIGNIVVNACESPPRPPRAQHAARARAKNERRHADHACSSRHVRQCSISLVNR